MIRIENLTKYYGDVCAVNGINLEIKKGEIMGLLGPNGAGKTTTMRILTCYLRPTSGNIYVKDFNVLEHPVEIKRMMGYLPESAPLYPDMIVYDYLRFVADVRGIDKARQETRIKELADMCGINEVMHKSIGELSKGYKQRVGLAHAMMNDPEILVLDEPTSGLDPNQIIEIREIIKTIGREKTVILSTHILSEVEATCDRVVIINRGSIVADGPKEELKSQRGKDYTIRISLRGDSFDVVSQRLRLIRGVKNIELVRKDDGVMDMSLYCSGERDIRPEVYSTIRDNNWILLEFHREMRTLETIFRELTVET